MAFMDIISEKFKELSDKFKEVPDKFKSIIDSLKGNKPQSSVENQETSLSPTQETVASETAVASSVASEVLNPANQAPSTASEEKPNIWANGGTENTSTDSQENVAIPAPQPETVPANPANQAPSTASEETPIIWANGGTENTSTENPQENVATPTSQSETAVPIVSEIKTPPNQEAITTEEMKEIPSSTETGEYLDIPDIPDMEIHSFNPNEAVAESFTSASPVVEEKISTSDTEAVKRAILQRLATANPPLEAENQFAVPTQGSTLKTRDEMFQTGKQNIITFPQPEKNPFLDRYESGKAI